MSRLTTITSSDDIARVLKCGRRYTSPSLRLYILESPKQRDQSGRVAFIAGKRLGGAVWRNRSKRVLRAAVYDQAHAELLAAVVPLNDILLVANRKTSEAGSRVVADELRLVLQKIQQHKGELV
jgi:ribonuclease P protein component